MADTNVRRRAKINEIEKDTDGEKEAKKVKAECDENKKKEVIDNEGK